VKPTPTPSAQTPVVASPPPRDTGIDALENFVKSLSGGDIASAAKALKEACRVKGGRFVETALPTMVHLAPPFEVMAVLCGASTRVVSWHADMAKKWSAIIPLIESKQDISAMKLLNQAEKLGGMDEFSSYSSKLFVKLAVVVCQHTYLGSGKKEDLHADPELPYYAAYHYFLLKLAESNETSTERLRLSFWHSVALLLIQELIPSTLAIPSSWRAVADKYFREQSSFVLGGKAIANAPTAPRPLSPAEMWEDIKRNHPAAKNVSISIFSLYF